MEHDCLLNHSLNYLFVQQHWLFKKLNKWFFWSLESFTKLICSAETKSISSTTSDQLCEWVFWIIHSIDLFNNIQLFRNETSDYSWVSHLNHSLCWFVQKNWIIPEKTSYCVYKWDIWIIRSFDLFNTTDSFRTGQMIVFVIESFKSFSISWTALIYSRMKKVTFHEWVNWIIHSVDLFRGADLFVNGTSDCLWVIWIC